MDKKLTLYFFPGSYFSSKACMILYEKELPFEEVYVNIRSGEQRSEWYMSINPKGEVPALKHGDQIIVDSENIVDYVDTTFTKEPKLVPVVTTSQGQKVQELRRMLDTIKIDHITYGTFANENLRVGKIKIMPSFLLKTVSKQALAKEYDDSIKELNERLAVSPEIASDIKWKIKDLEEKRDVVLSEKKASAALDTLEPIFDKLEESLENAKRGNSGNLEYWLTGNDFTAADITTSILLFRMWFIGLDERYFTQAKRPLLYQYYQRVQRRPGFQKMAQTFNKSYLLVMKGIAGHVALKLLKVGILVGLVGLGVYAYREFRKK